MDRNPPTLDMTPDGNFRTRPSARTGVGIPFSTKMILGSVLVAGLGLSLAVAAVAVWVLSMLLPVIVLAGGAAWAALKWRQWQRGSSSTGRAWSVDRSR